MGACCQTGLYQQFQSRQGNSTNGLNNLVEIDNESNYQNEIILFNQSPIDEKDCKIHKEIKYSSQTYVQEKEKILVHQQDTLLKVKDSSLYVVSLNVSDYSHSFSGTNISPEEKIKQTLDVKIPKKEWIVKQDIFVKHNLDKDVNSKYDIKDLLGQGGFGKVYRVIHKATGMIRAMKIIPLIKMKKEEEQILLQETQTMIDIDHVNVVKLFEIFKDDQFYYLISEYCDGIMPYQIEGGELFEKIRHINLLSEQVIASYMKQIISAIMYCHKMGIVHRDLKPENILFDSKKPDACIKIIDFGASAKLLKDGNHLSKRVGTPFYVAPEVLAANYNEKCDIWSMGVILYILICGYPPFFGVNQQEILKKVKQGSYQFDTTYWSKVSIQAKDLIRLMLFYEPDQRITAQQAYNHPWIQNNKLVGELQNQVLEKLGGFHIKNKLKMAIIEFISVQVVTSQEKKDLQREFQDLDQNGDGMVSKYELFLAYNKLYDDKIKAQKIVDEIFEDIDINGSGNVDFSEFVAAAINKQLKLSQLMMEQSFKLFDLDGDGFITRFEVEELFGGNELDDIMWNEILTECDDNKDGMISQQEFMKLLALQASKDDNFISE